MGGISCIEGIATVDCWMHVCGVGDRGQQFEVCLPQCEMLPLVHFGVAVCCVLRQVMRGRRDGVIFSTPLLHDRCGYGSIKVPIQQWGKATRR